MSFGVGSSYIHIHQHYFWVKSSKPKVTGTGQFCSAFGRGRPYTCVPADVPAGKPCFLKLTPQVVNLKKGNQVSLIHRSKTGKAMTVSFKTTHLVKFWKENVEGKRLNSFSVSLENAISLYENSTEWRNTVLVMPAEALLYRLIRLLSFTLAVWRRPVCAVV